jgi:hypothetical protein
MKEQSPSPADRRVTLLRPFLGFDRATLEAFARKQGIQHREDASNQDLTIPRNRVRHQLIPDWMARHSPALPRVLARIADIAAQEADYLREQAQRWRDSDHPATWASLHVALQRAILRMELLEQGRNAEFETVERLRLTRDASQTSKAAHPSPNHATVSAINVSRCHPTEPSETVSVVFRGLRGQRVLPDGSLFRWKRLKRAMPFGHDWEQLDAATVPETATLRRRQPGDRFQRLGQSKPARLQNLFINQRIPAAERAQRWVLELAGGNLAWVEGFSGGELHRLHPSTSEILAIRIQRP